jgi:hypothetical protein
LVYFKTKQKDWSNGVIGSIPLLSMSVSPASPEALDRVVSTPRAAKQSSNEHHEVIKTLVNQLRF